MKTSVFVKQPDGRWEFLLRTEIPVSTVLDMLNDGAELDEQLLALRVAMAARLKEITGVIKGTVIADFMAYPWGYGPFPLTPNAVREIQAGQRAKLVNGL